LHAATTKTQSPHAAWWSRTPVAFGYAADSDETALRNAGGEILHDLTDLPDMLAV
jgi:hypothetical protein